MKKVLNKTLKVVLIIIAVIVLFVIVSFVRHKICISNEKDMLTPLGELVEVNGNNMSVYRGQWRQNSCIHVWRWNLLADIGFQVTVFAVEQ